ncbi:hypothetical protein [Actinosynnema sp. NPDC023587]|uniref:hypothetical protein n=1 Tax=Actinosynnema sp. NPDC023587 TaxID=3154695 RepID=UPI003401BE57
MSIKIVADGSTLEIKGSNLSEVQVRELLGQYLERSAQETADEEDASTASGSGPGNATRSDTV